MIMAGLSFHPISQSATLPPGASEEDITRQHQGVLWGREAAVVLFQVNSDCFIHTFIQNLYTQGLINTMCIMSCTDKSCGKVF